VTAVTLPDSSVVTATGWPAASTPVTAILYSPSGRAAPALLRPSHV
jgi:hypothetical protein